MLPLLSFRRHTDTLKLAKTNRVGSVMPCTAAGTVASSGEIRERELEILMCGYKALHLSGPYSYIQQVPCSLLAWLRFPSFSKSLRPQPSSGLTLNSITLILYYGVATDYFYQRWWVAATPEPTLPCPRNGCVWRIVIWQHIILKTAPVAWTRPSCTSWTDHKHVAIAR